MMVKRFQKKPVIVRAMQYDGSNLADVIQFAGSDNVKQTSRQIEKAGEAGEEFKLRGFQNEWPTASPGDWIIQGIKGEFYPCKDEVLRLTYDELSD